MKRVVSFIGILLFAMGGNSALRTSADALRIAGEFASASVSGPAVKRLNSGAVRQQGAMTIADSTALYLAVNTASGYVLVGADDCLPEVLGYSDNGAFDADNTSPAFRYWMECYAEELEAIRQQSAQAGESGLTVKRNSGLRTLSAITPLCSSKWNQGSPYNDFAPAYNDNGGKCVTGCVATAMAQVMYYYKHPAQGTGSHSYLWVCTEPLGKSGTLSANFGSTTYQWSNMIDSYRSGYTLEQSNAVATLMYHCGVSVDMSFGQSSGAYTEKVPVALKDYFSYDANYQRIQKVMYPADSLNAIVAAELKANRPVIVSGHNDEGGHAFVCDGCDTKGYFHINWGWGGSNDGYYLLTALNPGNSQGIGGTTKGYNKGTTFFIGLQPAKSGTPKAIPQMATTNFSVSTSSVNRGTSFTVSIARLENFGLTNFSGSYGVALYDEDETRLVRVLKQVDNYSLSAGYHRTTAAELTVSIPTSTTTVPNGTYHLCCVYKDANYGWMRMLCTEDDYYRTLDITSTKATFYANDAEPVLALTKAIAFPEGTNLDSVPKTGCPLSFAIKNTGGTFRGEISARIYKGNFSKGQYEIMDSVVIRRNQTLSSALQQAFDANLQLDTQYKMRLCYRTGPSTAWQNLTPDSYMELPFKLYDPEYHLSLTDTIHFDRNDSVPRNDANLYYSIKNTGAPFDGELQVSFYQEPFTRGKSEIKTIHVGTNETLEGAFSGPLEQVPGTYTVIMRYREMNGDWQEFYDKNGYNVGMITATVAPEPPLELAYSDNICAGTGYVGYGFDIPVSELPAPGSTKDFIRSNPDKYQRDSIITLTLTTKAVSKRAIEASICSYEYYEFDGQKLNTSGTYTYNGTAANGCDSIVTLTLTVTESDTMDVSVTVLNNTLPYEVDAFYTVPADAPVGAPFEAVVYTEGCSYNRYQVTVNRCGIAIEYEADVCAGSDYVGYGFSIAAADLAPAGESKQFSHTARSAEDCDSVTTLTLTTKAVAKRAIEASICSYEYYEFDGQKLNTSGTYTYNGTAANGCDSIVTLTLTVTESDTTDVPVNILNNALPYEVDEYYTVPADAAVGTPFEAVVYTEGCSYNRYLVTVNRCSVTVEYADAVCAGSEYVGYGFAIAADELAPAGESKQFSHTARSAEDCDSVTTLTLTTKAVAKRAIEASICSYEYYEFDGQKLNTSGTYTYNGTAANGCDSIVTLTLTVTESDTTDVSVTVLNNTLPYEVDAFYTVPADAPVGAPFDTVIYKEGCSYNRYQVTVNRCGIAIEYEADVCAGSDYVGYGFSIAAADLAPAGESKQFSHTARSAEDCDSVTTLTLTTKAVSKRAIEASICSNEFYEFDGQKLNTSGEYTYRGYTSEGCDSIVTLNLAVTPVDTVAMDPVTVKKSELPYEVDVFYTVPAEASVGSFEAVVKNSDDCSYNRYFITVVDDATGIDPVKNGKSSSGKYMIDGVLFILHDGKIYNAQGALIK